MVQIRHKVILKNLSYSEIIKCFAYFFQKKIVTTRNKYETMVQLLNLRKRLKWQDSIENIYTA